MGIERVLRAETEEQRAILLIFPHKKSDWNAYLKCAQKCYIDLIRAILAFEEVILCLDTRDSASINIINKAFASELRSHKLHITLIKSNDTWVRDFGPISILQDGKNTMLDFKFNGWGEKFNAKLDNKLNRKLYKRGILENLVRKDFVLEGGSIDSNGEGIALSSNCIFNKNRNGGLSAKYIKKYIKNTFGLRHLLVLENGFLQGDDTDGHIDNIARFIARDHIVYVSCDDKKDVHYKALSKMQNELEEFARKYGFKLTSLPLPSAIFYKKERLPVSYCNFLFVNNGLIVPIFNDKKDKEVLRALQSLLPKRRVVGVDSRVLARWHGGIHCASMQLY